MKLYNKEFVCERCGKRYLQGSISQGVYGKELYPINKPLIGIKYVAEEQGKATLVHPTAGNRIDLCGTCMQSLLLFLTGEKIQSEMPVDISEDRPKHVTYFKEA